MEQSNLHLCLPIFWCLWSIFFLSLLSPSQKPWTLVTSAWPTPFSATTGFQCLCERECGVFVIICLTEGSEGKGQGALCDSTRPAWGRVQIWSSVLSTSLKSWVESETWKEPVCNCSHLTPSGIWWQSVIPGLLCRDADVRQLTAKPCRRIHCLHWRGSRATLS